MDLSEHFARHVVSTGYQELPEAAQAAAKASFVDGVAAVLAGSSAKGVDTVVKLAKGWTGGAEASIALTGDRVSAVAAAWANGTMARARDIDDVHDLTGDHPGIGAVIAAVAVSELVGDVDGKTVLTAIALAVDVVLRLRLGGQTPPQQLPWTTGTYAPVGAAIAAGKLLRLDAGQMRDALGIAFAQMSNTRQSSKDGALIHRVHHGLAIGNGIMAALLARDGISGAANSLEGTWGYAYAFENGRYSSEVALEGLGSEFRGVDVRVKRFPCCAHTHYAIENMRALRAKHGFAPDQVAQVFAHINERGFKSVCEPIERKWVPQTIVDAQWSLPYVAAVAAVQGDVSFEDLSDQGIRRPHILDFACRIQPVATAEHGDDSAIMPCTIEIVMKDGSRLTSRLPTLKGSPADPLTIPELIDKVRKCSRVAAVPISEGRIADFAAAVSDIEKRNVAEIVRGIWAGDDGQASQSGPASLARAAGR